MRIPCSELCDMAAEDSCGYCGAMLCLEHSRGLEHYAACGALEVANAWLEENDRRVAAGLPKLPHPRRDQN